MEIMDTGKTGQKEYREKNHALFYLFIKAISLMFLLSFILASLQYFSNLTLTPYLEVRNVPNLKVLFVYFLPSSVISALLIYLLYRYTPKYADISNSIGFKWVIYWCFIFITFTLIHAILNDTIITLTRDSETHFRFKIGDGSNFDFFVFNLGRGLQDSAWVTAFSCFVYFILSYRREVDSQRVKNAELSLHLSQARMDALTAQLNPHFLFNALHTVSALSHEHPDRANAVIAQLGSILRIALTRNDRLFITLKEEIAFVKEYVGIETVRFGDRLSCEWHINTNADSQNVPPFLLQPLVENAIKYGVNRNEGKTDLLITARLQGEHLMLEVSHHNESPEGPNDHAHGLKIGMKNLIERLDTLYGKDQWLLEQRFENDHSKTMILIPGPPNAS
jgi:hypothetical protein